MITTAITGGIGTGKSVVSRILIALGYPVYDCDAAARQIMDNDVEIHNRLCSLIHPDAVSNGIIDRPLISSIVFSDPSALQRLNSIVHPALLEHLHQWLGAFNSESHAFVETAILYETTLWQEVTDVWEVKAPIDVRIDRIVRRNGITPGQARSRIEAQHQPSPTPRPHIIIDNDNISPLLPQIFSLLKLQ